MLSLLYSVDGMYVQITASTFMSMRKPHLTAIHLRYKRLACNCLHFTIPINLIQRRKTRKYVVNCLNMISSHEWSQKLYGYLQRGKHNLVNWQGFRLLWSVFPLPCMFDRDEDAELDKSHKLLQVLWSYVIIQTKSKAINHHARIDDTEYND